MDFNLQDLLDIRSGKAEGWERIGDPSAYGGIFRSPSNPGKVVKIQEGDFATYDNEIARQFEAYMNRPSSDWGQFSTPALGQTGFFPTEEVTGMHNDLFPNDVPVNKFEPMQQGISFIEMDEADFDTTEAMTGREQLSRAKGLIDLHRQGIAHRDTHGGNIKYNINTDQPVILDYGLAGRTNIQDYAHRTAVVQAGLEATGNTDLLDLWNEVNGDLVNDKLSATNSKDTRAANRAWEDWIRQGEDVVMRTDMDTPPIDLGGLKQEPEALRQEPVSKRQGAQKFGGPAQPAVGVLGSSFFPTTEPKGLSKLTGLIKGALNKPFVKGSLSVGAADFIPSAEALRTAETKGIPAGVGQMGNEFLRGMPIALTAGMVTAAAPVTVPVVAGAGTGMLLTEGARSLNELTRIGTGETALSKFRQAIGTEERTGLASPGNSFKEQMAKLKDPVIPVITQTTRPPVRLPLEDTPMPAVARRLRLAGERFNPSKGEFGITELLFGR